MAASGDHFTEQAAHDLAVHGGAHHQAALLGRIARTGDQVSGVRVFDQRVDKEQRRAFHEWIGRVAQELFVGGEEVVLP